MLEILTVAFNTLLVMGGLVILTVMLGQIRLYRRQMAGLAPRVARTWTWRIVSGMCGALVFLCFGLRDLSAPSEATGWLLILGVFATGGCLVAMVRLSVLDARS